MVLTVSSVRRGSGSCLAPSRSRFLGVVTVDGLLEGGTITEGWPPLEVSSLITIREELSEGVKYK